MCIFSDTLSSVLRAVEKLAKQGEIPSGLDLSRVIVEPPRDPSHGDIATNAAMVLARSAGVPVQVLAEKLVRLLGIEDHIESALVAGPGFINLRLRESCWHAALIGTLALGDDIARLNLGGGRRVNVEYVSANPTGPLHVGHCRGAVFGDALASLLETVGYSVVREYYINDAGIQVDRLAHSVFMRYREALGEQICAIPDNLYPGDYLVSVGQQLAERFGRRLKEKSEGEWLPIIREFAIGCMMDQIRSDLKSLCISHDIFFSESTLHSGTPSEVDNVISNLQERGLVYQGVLPPPKGQIPDDWEYREQTLFRASEFGDSMDRPLMKPNGEHTYFAADMAYFRNKYERGFEEMVYVLGADHDGYVKRLEAVATAIAGKKAKVIVRLCQLVRLYRDGEPVKMSKRSGEFVTLRDVVDEVGVDSVRFMMLYRNNDAPLDFDFVKVKEQSRDNPVFYVQYAHARACSVLRKAQELLSGLDLSTTCLRIGDLSVLSDDTELDLIKKLTSFQRVLGSAALSHEPHRIAFYLYDTAGAFHSLWNKGKESPSVRFINPADLVGSRARLALVQAVALVLSRGLGILGVEALKEMC